MDRLKTFLHHKETFLYATSKMFERGAYYGTRALIIMYVTGEVFKMTSSEIDSLYGWFAGIILCSKFLGAIIGDLVIGNRKPIIIGCIMQSIGAFSLCFPTAIALYTGLSLIILGGGLYGPNIISSFGKLYLGKTKLLDSAFSILYLAINIGSFLGILCLGYIGERYTYNHGFALAGILMLLSLIPILFIKEKQPVLIIKDDLSVSKRAWKVAILLVLAGSFWTISQVSELRFSDVGIELIEISTYDLLPSLWGAIRSIFYIPICLFLIVLWTYFFSSQLFKLMLGSLFAVISFGILFLLPESLDENYTALFLISLFFLSLSEIYVGPVIDSVITQYANPKYLAIFFSLAFIPPWLFAYIVFYFNEGLKENSSLAILVALIAMAVLSLGLIIYYFQSKKLNFKHLNQPDKF